MELHILLFCLTLLWFLIKPFLHRSTTTKLPPGPTGLPVLGSLLQLGPRPNQSLADLSKLHGPLMTLRLGSVTTIVASSAETAKELFQKHDQTLSDRTIPDVITAQPNPEATLAWVSGNHQWRNRRRICNTQMFTIKRLDSLQHSRHEKARELVGHIAKHCVSATPVDIGRVAFATTINMMSQTIFSMDLVDPESESAQEFKDMVWRIMEDAGKPNLSDHFPVLRWLDLQGVKRHIKPAYMRLHEVFEDVIDKRLKSRASEGMTNRTADFLDVLLDQCDEEGSGFTRQTIKPLILDLFIAGSDTSAITTEWAMAELLRKPDVLQKARKEIVETIGTKRLVTETDIDQLPYLQAVVKETMRLHPAAPLLLPYKAGDDTELLGFTIPKGSQVLVNAWAIGRDPKCWDNPLSFSPERFLDSNLDYKGRDFEYIPFGAGRRICPGMPLAARMVSLMLASIIQSFGWRLPEGTTPENLDMEEQFGVTLKKAVSLLVIPTESGDV
ncbi:geraniol 8-hydroxylase-like [Cornus florida]|uniref:geraniol 8-hydroxylase-like n=1 Tax=Cornus florida TaxID=4283 RepID=UPI0028A2B581|nr:geraniol 8-hydroxylase-like [Cornus florida]